MESNDNICAFCEIPFSKMKSIRNKFPLFCIPGNYPELKQKDTFVCQGCRNMLKRKYNSIRSKSPTTKSQGLEASYRANTHTRENYAQQVLKLECFEQPRCCCQS